MELKSYIKYKLAPKEKGRFLELDKRYGELMANTINSWNCNRPDNVDSEYKKFIENYRKGIDYYPQFNIPKKTSVLKSCLKGFQQLLDEWDVNCLLTPLYKERISTYMKVIRFALDPKHLPEYLDHFMDVPSMADYMAALDMMEQNPYELVDDESRPIDADKAFKHCKAYIDKHYPGFEVRIKNDQIPRMCVRSSDMSLDISSDAKFNDIDLDGLDVHEIEQHVARRYYGAKTGLNLFIFGTSGINYYDEGIAIYNSLYKVDKKKPNILFNIAIKCCIGYDINKLSFVDLFKKYSRYGMPERKLFDAICRFKRYVQDSSILGGNTDDTAYFIGYNMLKDNPEIHDELTRINIGPDYVDKLDDYKAFLEINEFDPLI